MESKNNNTVKTDDIYCVCETWINSETGQISVNTAHGPYKDHDEATDAMAEMYRKALEECDLQDNDACDEDGNAIPGGYFNYDQAGIYNNADFALGQLLELVSFTVVRLR